MNRFDEIPNSKDEFLQSLEMLLAPLSETERKDALSFYLEYFDEAGSENEMSVLNQLGSPKSVADKILSESGYVTEVDEEKNEGENDKKEETIKSNTPISNTKSSIQNPALSHTYCNCSNTYIPHMDIRYWSNNRVDWCFNRNFVWHIWSRPGSSYWWYCNINCRCGGYCKFSI